MVEEATMKGHLIFVSKEKNSTTALTRKSPVAHFVTGKQQNVDLHINKIN